MTLLVRARSVHEVTEALSRRPDARIVCGATDVYPERAHAAALGRPMRDCLVDVSDVGELRGISDRGGFWRIGAGTTWSEIAEADLPEAFEGLKLAAREIGGVQIQNRGTIGGNICTASPAGDSIPCLMCLDARVEVATREGRQLLPLDEFIVGYRRTVAGERRGVVTAVLVPHRQGRGDFLKVGARTYLVISIVMAASLIELDDGGVVRRAAIAVGACSPVARRLRAAEAALVGNRPDPALVTGEHLVALTPLDDVRASATYRRHAALTLVRDLTARAAGVAGGVR
jgi:N-methylhydantoinase B